MKLTSIIQVKFITSLVLLLSIAGCSPKVVGIYNDGVGRNAKSFLIILQEKEKELSEENEKLDNQLQEIISESLVNKGLEASRLPDLYVSYMINVHTATDTQPDHYNYNRFNYYNYYYNNPYYGFSSRTYKQGVFIIDIRNSENLLVWQGSKEFKLRSREGVPDVLPEICNEVIAVFDPNH